jgi:large repetitive protein
MTIPVAGIPTTVTRGYDTLNAGKDGDFGYGWTFNIANAQLEVDTPEGLVSPNLYPPMAEGTRVYVTMPGGKREGFTFYLKPEIPPDWYGQIVYLHPTFIPDPGVTDRLSVPDEPITLDGDQYNFYTTFGYVDGSALPRVGISGPSLRASAA